MKSLGQAVTDKWPMTSLIWTHISKNFFTISSAKVLNSIQKLLGEYGIQVLLELFSNMNDKSIITLYWGKSIFDTISKKPDIITFYKYRIIILLNHVLRLFLCVTHKRKYENLEEIEETQFEFRK